MFRTLLLPLLALLCAALPGQDEAKILSSFKKAFAPAKGNKDAPPVAAKRSALEATSGLDSGKVAQVLVDAWRDLDEDLAEVDALRHAYNEELKEILKGKELDAQRTLPQPKFQRMNELQPLLVQLRERGDALRELSMALGERIGELRRRDSVLFLLKKVCGHKKSPLPLRLAAAEAVGASASEVLDELATAISRARNEPEQIVLLDAMALAGETARMHATPVIKLLDSREPAVAERAALALAKLAVPEAIEPMITLLSRSTGQMQLRVAAALEVLTGEQFGENIGAWHAWWKSQGAEVVASGRELGKGTPSNRKKTNENYYFGIPQSQSDAILYVLDCSGSMSAPVRTKNVTSASGQPEEVTRLEACQVELCRALAKLRPDQKFAILYYNDLPHMWEENMQKATPEAVARAQEFVNTLKPASTTNIHDSLELGFGLSGRGAHDKYYGTELDTIFLLTDGSPTKPDSSPDSTEKILLGVRSWNPLKRVTIHCIAIGQDLNRQFLEQLAGENGGEFKQF